MDHPSAKIYYRSSGFFLGKSKSDPDPPRQSSQTFSSEYKHGTETILFVEDLEPLRTVIADSLAELGYHVLPAASGDEALTLSASYGGEIHLLLTDVIMPHMKGPELARKILGARPQLKVIYLSGFADGVLAPHGVLEEGTILVHKPFTIKILSAKIREVLGSIV